MLPNEGPQQAFSVSVLHEIRRYLGCIQDEFARTPILVVEEAQGIDIGRTPSMDSGANFHLRRSSDVSVGRLGNIKLRSVRNVFPKPRHVHTVFPFGDHAAKIEGCLRRIDLLRTEIVNKLFTFSQHDRLKNKMREELKWRRA